MPVVLDSWALLALLNDEPAAERVRAAWVESGAAMCSINLGEALYLLIRAGGEKSARATIDQIRRDMETIEPDWVLVAAAAAIKAKGGLSYADAFCVATAQRLDTALWTGDPEILTVAERLNVKFVDLR